MTDGFLESKCENLSDAPWSLTIEDWTNSSVPHQARYMFSGRHDVYWADSLGELIEAIIADFTE